MCVFHTKIKMKHRHILTVMYMYVCSYIMFIYYIKLKSICPSSLIFSSLHFYSVVSALLDLCLSYVLWDCLWELQFSHEMANTFGHIK